MVLRLYIARTPDGNNFPLPSYTSKYHIGLNLMAAIGNPLRVNPAERVRIPVGFAIGVPQGFCGQILSFPNLSQSHGLIVADAPHLLNPTDREPIFIQLHNISSKPYVIHRGDIIAQLVVMPAVQVYWNDLSLGQAAGSPTPEDTIVVDTGDTQELPKKDLFKSSRREKNSIRNRYKKTDETG